jgi:hypothetical protein
MPTLLDLIHLEMDIHMYLCELNELDELEERIDKAIEMFNCINNGIEEYYELNFPLRPEATTAFIGVIAGKARDMISQDVEGLFNTCTIQQRSVFMNTIKETLEIIKTKIDGNI